jgi:hypothetical protein
MDNKIEVPILQYQLSSLYHASQSLAEAEQVFSVASVSEFEYGSQQKIAQIIIRLMRNGEVTPALVGRLAKNRWTCTNTSVSASQVSIGEPQRSALTESTKRGLEPN